MSKQRVITTPIYYCNARPHLGHSYGSILADFLVRLCELRGEEAILLTGTDEHGEKMAQCAAKAGKDPQAYCDEHSAFFREAWEKLGLKIDVFYRTSAPKHHLLVQNALQRLYDKGDIYFAEYEGKYCVGCERYRKDSELNEAGQCPDHLIAPEIRREPNYFFKMSQYQERLVTHYKQNPQSLEPEHYRKEVLSMLQEPLEDLNISRPKERLSWGIELPFDKKFVAYVWFDALLSYLGGIGYTGKERLEELPLWENSYHTLAKDILKTHAIYWPSMLWALDLPAPKKLIVYGYWLVKGHKMSKSLGNVVEPLTFAQNFGAEAMRYYLLSEMSFGTDSSMTIESFIHKVNGDLANGIGNLSSRTLTLAVKNFDNKVPPRGSLLKEDQDLLNVFEDLPQRVFKEFDDLRIHMGIKYLMEAVSECDKYINHCKPWAMAKAGETERLGTVLSVSIEALHKIAVLMSPLLPEGSQKLLRALGWANNSPITLEHYTQVPPAGSTLGEVPRLYARLEAPKDLDEST